jgi:uncharacterized protein
MNEKKAIVLLKKYSTDKERFNIIYGHSKKVQEISLRIAKKVKKNYPKLNISFIKNASLLHDIGRFSCPPLEKNSIRHGIKGAEILRKEGLQKYAKFAERHIGAGISKKDIIEQKLDLPLKDYMPKSMEEKIISHADNVTKGDKESDFNDVYEAFKNKVNKKCADKVKKLKEEVEGWMRKK